MSELTSGFQKVPEMQRTPEQDGVGKESRRAAHSGRRDSLRSPEAWRGACRTRPPWRPTDSPGVSGGTARCLVLSTVEREEPDVGAGGGGPRPALRCAPRSRPRRESCKARTPQSTGGGGSRWLGRTGLWPVNCPAAHPKASCLETLGKFRKSAGECQGGGGRSWHTCLPRAVLGRHSAPGTQQSPCRPWERPEQTYTSGTGPAELPRAGGVGEMPG